MASNNGRRFSTATSPRVIGTFVVPKGEVDVKVIRSEEATLVSLVPDTVEGERCPCDITCVIDVSGSMASNAVYQTGDGVETVGLSVRLVLDIVKHSLATIIATLGEKDTLSVVTFTDDAKRIMSFQQMHRAGKQVASALVASLTPQMSTNIWAGLKEGVNLLSEGDSAQRAGRLPVVMLLTDGMPNVNPPRGHIPMLKMLKEQLGGELPHIMTFGFGYAMDSELLTDIASVGKGTYSFIPDSGMVGTVFDHSLAKVLTTVGTAIEFQSGISRVDENFGSLHNGQSRDFLIPNRDITLPLTIKYKDVKLGTYVSHQVDISAAPSELTLGEKVKLRNETARLLAVKGLFEANALAAKEKLPEAFLLLTRVCEDLRNLLKTINGTEKDNAYIFGLITDLEGQACEGVSMESFYRRWGRHFLPSLTMAHAFQYCNNFKDAGVQFYGGPVFTKLRDEIDEIFMKLPPPKPSNPLVVLSPRYSMASYHNARNPCFAGWCLITMSDGSKKRVDALTKGDRIKSPTGASATVICVVETLSESDESPMVSFDSGLVITPYHPIHLSGRWEFPINIREVQQLACKSVFSFVLDTEHIMTIGGIECVTLAHNFTDPVVAHPYFGSKRILKDLEATASFSSGHILLAPNPLIRDPVSGLLCGLRKEAVIIPEMPNVSVSLAS